MDQNEITTIQFIKPWSNYNAGQVAGFRNEQANKIIAGGKAKLVKQPLPAAKASGKTAAVTKEG
jgi:hypothetical protein